MDIEVSIAANYHPEQPIEEKKHDPNIKKIDGIEIELNPIEHA